MASKKKRKPSRPSAAGRRATPPAGRVAPKISGASPGATRATRTTLPAASGPKGPTRAERLAAAEKARRTKATRTRALIASVLVGVVTLITVTVISSRRSNDRTVTKLEASGSCAYDTKADTDGGAGNNHVDGDVKYATDPPAGGNHSPTAAPPGIVGPEDKPTDAKAVHSLEHGYVSLWYRPDLASPALDELKALAGRYPRDVLLIPRESLRQPVAATAWHRRLLCSQPDAASVEQFVTAYRNKGPEKIPH